MDYEVYLRTEAFEFLRHRHTDARSRLLRLFHELGRDPYRRGDFSERDLSGRERRLPRHSKIAHLLSATWTFLAGHLHLELRQELMKASAASAADVTPVLSGPAAYVTYYSVGGGRMSVVALAFHERVIHQQS
jgi:hypothetical protein